MEQKGGKENEKKGVPGCQHNNILLSLRSRNLKILGKHVTFVPRSNGKMSNRTNLKYQKKELL